MKRIDVFAHVLLPNFYGKMLAIDPDIPKKYAFFNNIVLQDMEVRKSHWDKETKQIISYVNANPEDITDPANAEVLCREANVEISQCVDKYPEMFDGCVGMLPMNNIEGAVRILKEQIDKDSNMHGVQLFTRHLGKSIANPEFEPVFAALNELKMPLWIHPVFDLRKPDNNLIFSWEYELSQAMLQIVQAGYMRKYPDIKIIIHHAGGMAPFFAGRIDRILPKEQSEDFRKFYVDTAILGNPKALDLAVDFFGLDRVVFGTDAPLGILPAGATKEILEAIDDMQLSEDQKEQIRWKNYQKMLGGK